MVAQISSPIRQDAAPAAAGGVPLQASTALVWRCWADAVVRYWEALLAQGLLDPGACLSVLDFGAADGDLAWAMPSVLQARLDNSSCAGLHLQYFCCDGEPVPIDARATANGLVCIGWQSVNQQPSECLAVHYGAIHSATDDGTWQPYVPEAGLRRDLLAHYVAECPSAVLTLPMAMCALHTHVAALARGRYLIIGADVGATTLRQLRAQSTGSNLHALLLARRADGASTWSTQHRDDGMAVYLACDNAQLATHAASALAAAHPDDAALLSALAVGASPAHAIALLRSSAYDPAVLRACAAALLHHAQLDQEWQPALVQAWSYYRMPAADDRFYRQLAELAVRAGHWGLAKSVLHAGIAQYGDNAADRRQLARCTAATGTAGSAQSDQLTLVVLRHDHIAALCRQYRDPGIGAMCSLPSLEDPATAAQWITEEQHIAGKRSYAILHACWGLVGVLGLHRAGDAAHFYFWTGTDFQGSGYAARAARLAFARAAREGIRQIYTNVYADNIRSLRTLGRLGFEQLPLQAQAPYDEFIFLRKTLAATSESDALVLNRLYAAAGSPFHFLQEQEAGMAIAHS